MQGNTCQYYNQHMVAPLFDLAAGYSSPTQLPLTYPLQSTFYPRTPDSSFFNLLAQSALSGMAVTSPPAMTVQPSAPSHFPPMMVPPVETPPHVGMPSNLAATAVPFQMSTPALNPGAMPFTFLPPSTTQQIPSFANYQTAQFPVYGPSASSFVSTSFTTLPIQNQAKTQGPEGCNLFIFHIPNDLQDNDLYNLFCSFGDILSARIMVDQVTGTSRGFGFVTYSNPESAEAAIQSMNGFQIGRKHLKVQRKKDRWENAMTETVKPLIPAPAMPYKSSARRRKNNSQQQQTQGSKQLLRSKQGLKKGETSVKKTEKLGEQQSGSNKEKQTNSGLKNSGENGIQTRKGKTPKKDKPVGYDKVSELANGIEAMYIISEGTSPIIMNSNDVKTSA